MRVDAEKLVRLIEDILDEAQADYKEHAVKECHDRRVRRLRECFVEEPAPDELSAFSPAAPKVEECECGHPTAEHRGTTRACLEWVSSKGRMCQCSAFRPRVPQGEGGEPCTTKGHAELHALWTKAATGDRSTYVKSEWNALDNAMSSVQCDLRDARKETESLKAQLEAKDGEIANVKGEYGRYKLGAAASIERLIDERNRARAILKSIREALGSAEEGL